MNKNIFGVILVFGLISTIAVFLAMFFWAFNNDYVLYNVNLQAVNLKNASLISQTDLDYVETAGNEHASINFYFDYWWLLSYIVLVASTILVAYFSREAGLFSFLTDLFFGSMVFLFFLSIIEQVTSWVLNDLFYKMLPMVEGTMPFFEFYMAHIGIISFIHLMVCILVNRLYFKINEFVRKEDVIDSEVV